MLAAAWKRAAGFALGWLCYPLGPILMAPIYGNVTVYRWHSLMCITMVMLSLWNIRHSIGRWNPMLALLSVWISCSNIWIQSVFRYFSGIWGPEWGPMITLSILYLPWLYCATCITLAQATRSTSLFLTTLLECLFYSWVLCKVDISVYTVLADNLAFLFLIPWCVWVAQDFQSKPFHRQHFIIKCILFLSCFSIAYISLQEQAPTPPYRIVAKSSSLTGRIVIVDDLSLSEGTRFMKAGHSIIGGVYLNYNNDSIYGVFYYMDFGRYALQSKPTSPPLAMLQIGLGVGIATRSLLEHHVQLDLVEIDEFVYQAARLYFNLPLPNKLLLQDGRRALKEAEPHSYDAILHDVFTGGSVPSHLFSLECLQLIESRLKDQGLLILNYAGFEHSIATASVYNTLVKVFPFIRAFSDAKHVDSTNQSDTLVNIMFFCSQSNIEFDLPDPESFSGIYAHMLSTFLENELELQWPKDTSLVMTDKNNTLNELQWDSAIAHWHLMRQIRPIDFWLL